MQQPNAGSTRTDLVRVIHVIILEMHEWLHISDMSSVLHTLAKWELSSQRFGSIQLPSSSWLTVILLDRYSVTLRKAVYRDALCLQYGWSAPMLASHCAFGQLFTIAHALSCPTGGYPSIRHNKLHDITADLLKEVSGDVTVEPPLQPLTGEGLSMITSICGVVFAVSGGMGKGATVSG